MRRSVVRILREIINRCNDDPKRLIPTLFQEYGNMYATALRRKVQGRQNAGRNWRNKSVVSATKNIEKLVVEGRLSKAARRLEAVAGIDRGEDIGHDNVQLSMAQMRQAHERLYPPASAEDLLPDVWTGDVLTIEQREVHEALKNLPKGSAAGSSGWTNFLLRDLFDDVAHHGEALGILCRVFNLLLKGEHDVSHLTESRLVFIPKAGRSEYRPLGIGDAWYRLLGKVVSNRIGREVGARLQPLQLGVGISGGCEIGARIPQQVLERRSGHSVIALDLSNAFGTIRRGHIFNGLHEYAPQLIPFFLRAYGHESSLYSSQGEFIGTAATGVKQGDPLGSLLFCLGIHSALQSIDAMVHARVDDLGTPEEDNQHHCGVVAYMDDISIFCPKEAVSSIVPELPLIFDQLGMVMATNKSFVHGGGITEQEAGGLPVAQDGLVCMGAPTSLYEAYKWTYVRRFVDEATACLGALSHLKPWTALTLLRHCVNMRLSYLTRVVKPTPLVKNQYERFDDFIDKALFSIIEYRALGTMASLAHLPEVQMARVLRTLPLDLGGLGMVKHSGIAGATAYLRSCCLLANHLREFYPESLPTADADWGDGGGAELAEPPLIHMNPAPLISDRIKPQYLREIHVRRATVIRDHFAATNPKKAAWFLSAAFHGSGSWLVGQAGMLRSPFAFNDKESAEFRVSLRMRLLMTPFTSAAEQGAPNAFHCLCGQMVEVNSEYLHLLDCASIRGFAAQRHTRICQMLKAQLEYIGPSPNMVVTEPVVVPGTRADLSVQTASGIRYVDVSICNPSATTYILRGSATTPGRAGDIRGEQKDAHYAAAKERARAEGLVVPPGLFVWPLVWEATGRPSDGVNQFLQSVFIGPFAHRKKLILMFAQALTVRYCAKAVLAWQTLLDAELYGSQNGHHMGM
jgi:hypothetical protein